VEIETHVNEVWRFRAQPAPNIGGEELLPLPERLLGEVLVDRHPVSSQATCHCL
jgi:hypothetical protein